MSKENSGDNWPRLNRWSRVGSPLDHRLQGRQWKGLSGELPVESQAADKRLSHRMALLVPSVRFQPFALCMYNLNLRGELW